MSIVSFYLRNMLQQAERQPAAVRRLVRSRHGSRMDTGAGPDVSAEARRTIMVERVARELFENLLFTDCNTPMVEEVRRALHRAFGESLTFTFRPDRPDVVILRETSQGLEELPPGEYADALERAWNVTLAEVDASML